MIPQGYRFAGTRCGLKNKRNDLGLLLSDVPARAAGLFTTNQVRAACVDYSRAVLQKGTLRALVVNSGNANCCTGAQGERDTARMAALAADALGVPDDQVAVASTGVIGQLLDMYKVERGIFEAAQLLKPDPKPYMDAILTTDLVEKWAAFVDGETYSPWRPQVPAGSSARVYGLAKGSGMIAPNLATMLGFVLSDYDLEGIDLNAALCEAAAQSFNRMTVDGDTSTNDMLIFLANGVSGVRPSPAQFQHELNEVCRSLAMQVARDGEGATKLVEVRVTGSEDPTRIARTIAESPLVKTAMFGCDPNWGRILMAAGRAGVPFDPAHARLALIMDGEEHVLFENGGPAPFDPKRVSSALKAGHVLIDLRVGEGAVATIYTCDFSYGYVRINAEYHT